MMKTIATGILTTMSIGLLTGLYGLAMTQQELQANDRIHDHTYGVIERRLEKIENKNDIIIEMLLKKGLRNENR